MDEDENLQDQGDQGDPTDALQNEPDVEDWVDEDASAEELEAFKAGWKAESVEEQELPERDTTLPRMTGDEEDLGDGPIDELGDMTDEELKAEAARMRGEKPESTPEPEPESKPEPKAEADTTTDDDTEDDAGKDQGNELSNRMRRLETNLGNLATSIKSLMERGGAAARATASEGHDTPAPQQLQKAFRDTEAMNKLREEYPEFGEALDQALSAVTLPDAADFDERVNQAVDTRVNDVVSTLIDDRISEKHENWKETIQTPEFDAFIEAAPEDIRKLEQSPKPRDVVKLLDTYSDFRAWLGTQPEEIRENYTPAKQLDLYQKRDVNSGSSRRAARDQDRASRLDSAELPATRKGNRTTRRGAETLDEIFSKAYNGEYEQ